MYQVSPSNSKCSNTIARKGKWLPCQSEAQWQYWWHMSSCWREFWIFNNQYIDWYWLPYMTNEHLKSKTNMMVIGQQHTNKNLKNKCPTNTFAQCAPSQSQVPVNWPGISCFILERDRTNMAIALHFYTYFICWCFSLSRISFLPTHVKGMP